MTTLSRTGLDALYRRIQQEVDHGHVTSAQVAVGLGGEVVAAQSFGTATASKECASIFYCFFIVGTNAIQLVCISETINTKLHTQSVLMSGPKFFPPCLRSQ